MGVWRWSYLTGDSLKPHRSILCGSWFWCLKILIFHATWPLHANSVVWRKQLSRLILTQRSASFADWDYGPCSRCRRCRKGLWETAELTFAFCVSIGSRASHPFRSGVGLQPPFFWFGQGGIKVGMVSILTFVGRVGSHEGWGSTEQCLEVLEEELAHCLSERHMGSFCTSLLSCYYGAYAEKHVKSCFCYLEWESLWVSETVIAIFLKEFMPYFLLLSLIRITVNNRSLWPTLFN